MNLTFNNPFCRSRRARGARELSGLSFDDLGIKLTVFLKIVKVKLESQSKHEFFLKIKVVIRITTSDLALRIYILPFLYSFLIS